jgi:predicted acylesterase/phospholipase RssA
MNHLDALIDSPGPKRLLAIDGGGIRGLIAIEFLSQIETLLRERLSNEDLVLSDYFDYVCGTSTGAIVATLVSLGYSTDAIRGFYTSGAKTMFEPANVFQRIARRSHGTAAAIAGAIGVMLSPTIFTQRALEAQIKEIFGADTTLGSDRLRTLVMIVTRNASTDSPWPLSNNPRAKYNLRINTAGTSQATNLDLPLWQLVRASTAAPVFFPPEAISIPGLAKPFMFVDGGVTVYNNPAFLLFLMATLPPYQLQWPTGESNMLVVSVGTGLCESANLNLGPREMNLLYNVQSLPAALMRAATIEQDVLCRVFGRLRPGCEAPEVDSEIGDLLENRVPMPEKLFTYCRYNVELSTAGLRRLGIDDVDPKSVQPLDGVDHLAELTRVGETAARKCVSIQDFDGFLAVRPSREAPAIRRESTAEGSTLV